jgi:hypothetical protein
LQHKFLAFALGVKLETVRDAKVLLSKALSPFIGRDISSAYRFPVCRDKGNLKGYVDKYTDEEFGFPVIVGRKRNPY